MADTTTEIRREKHGHKKHQLQGRIQQLKDALNVALRFCPKNVREATAPLLKGIKPQTKTEEAPTMKEYADLDVRRTLRLNIANKLYQNIAVRGFFWRIGWAVKYIFCGIQGGDE